MLWSKLKCKLVGHDWVFMHYLRAHVCDRCGETDDFGENLYDE